MKAPLHCLHVLPDIFEGVIQRSLVRRVVTQALRYLYTERVGGLSSCVCAVTYGAEVSGAVIDYAKEQQAQLIVLGILHASSRPGEEARRTAVRVISEASCPVLTIAYAFENCT